MIAYPDRRPSHHDRLATLCLCVASAFLAPGALGSDDTNKIAVLITAKGSYRIAAEAAIERLQAAKVDCELIVVPTGDAHARQETLTKLRESASSLIVTGGAAMTEEALKAVPEVPVVFLMMPNALDASFLDKQSRYRDRVAGVTSDIAPEQRVDWIRRTYPDCKQVAVLCSDRSERTAKALESAGRALKIKITRVQASRDEFPAAIDALETGGFDGVVMVPDSQVYNSSTVQRLLLWGLRQKRPVWAFSENVVKAGALAGIQCNPREVGAQAAEVALKIRAGEAPQSIGLCYPQAVDTAVNLHTASMIGVAFEDAALTSKVTKFGEP